MIRIGRFARVHGIHGEVVCHLAPPFYYSDGFLKSIDVGCFASHHSWDVEYLEPDPRGFRVKFREINSIEEAEDLIGVQVFLPKHVLKQLRMIGDVLGKPADEWKGYKIELKGKISGEVTDIVWREAHPNFIIISTGKEWEFPAVEDLIEEIQDDTRIIKIRHLEGMDAF